MKSACCFTASVFALLTGCVELATQPAADGAPAAETMKRPDAAQMPDSSEAGADGARAGSSAVPGAPRKDASKSAPPPSSTVPALAKPAPPPVPTPADVSGLFRAIENDDYAEFSRLLGVHAHVGARNKLGETPLYVAAEKGRVGMVKVLLSNGADARALTPNGETVLHAASMIESAALTTELVKAGAEIDRANFEGETPLYWAAMTGTFLAVKALVDGGADLNVQETRLGNTALHAAAWHNDVVLVHFLLSKNARTDIRNKAGLTAFDFAKAGGRTSAIRLLGE